jgi:hypothetical protein
VWKRSKPLLCRRAVFFFKKKHERMREAEIDQERDAQGVRAYSGIYQDMLRERERDRHRE